MRSLTAAAIIAAALVIAGCSGGTNIDPKRETGDTGMNDPKDNGAGQDTADTGGSGAGQDTADTGGSGAGQKTDLLDHWRRYVAGNPTLDMTAAEVKAAWLAAAKGMKHEVVRYGSDDEVGTLDEVGTAIADRIEDLYGNATFTPVLQYGGIPLATVRHRYSVPEEDAYFVNLRLYGGWLDYTSFSTQRDFDTYGGNQLTDTYGSFLGNASESRPTGTGSASWTGLMVGMDALMNIPDSHVEPDVYLGDARITIDNLAAPDADVSFTNIWNVTEQRRRADISWQNLDITGEGVFYAAGETFDYIAGAFTGPNHEEAGGSFKWGGIAGSFGAERQ